ncbi:MULTISPECIES: hypothetical protein [Pseudomonas]|uniref:hypothetical protein n=1 Tax=Pseudomonas TaxID=286 RepID=UPI000760CCE0|nr:hypothetical protein [Pseudomonas monteilii]
MTRSQVKRRLALAWWQYLAVGLVPLPIMAWAFGGGDALMPVLAMPLFIAGAASMFLSLPRFGAYKRALTATSKALGTAQEPAAWINLAQVRRMGMLYACFPAWVGALSVLVGLEAVPQVLLGLSTAVLLCLYRISRHLG